MVLLFDGVVTAREDYKRHKDDHITNTQKTLVARGDAFVPVEWQHVRVGDILKLKRNENVPADCVFLASRTSDIDSPETCYVQTAQLDGETNLKLKQATSKTVAYFVDDAAATRFRGMLTCEAPNANFNRFVGTIRMGSARPAGGSTPGTGGPQGSSTGGSAAGLHSRASSLASPVVARELTGARAEASADGTAASGGAEQQQQLTVASAAGSPTSADVANLEVSQLLLRGCQVRNVDFAYAMVAYTGNDTKVRVKVTAKSSKRAQVEESVNGIVILVVALLLVISAMGAIGNALWNANHGDFLQYLVIDSITTFVQGLQQWATFLLLNSSFVPVALYVQMRLTRTLQMTAMELDKSMSHTEELTDAVARAKAGGESITFPFRVRSMELNDDLGQITHIFSDKTGTMTLNYMEFAKMAVGGVSYGLGTTTIGVARLRRLGEHAAADEAEAIIRAADAQPRITQHVNFTDGSESHPSRTLAQDARRISPPDAEQAGGNGSSDGDESAGGERLGGSGEDGSEDPGDAPGDAIHHFMLHLALNHTVLLETIRDDTGGTLGTRLSASSPDEEAFLLAAQHFGYAFVARSTEGITLRVPPAGGLAVPASPDAAAPASGVQSDDINALALAGGGAEERFFRVLHMLPYTQERKRMSVIVRHPDGRIVLYCKGADNVIYERLRVTHSAEDRTVRRNTSAYMGHWGSDGLRTLCFGCKELSEAQLAAWAHRYALACNDFDENLKRKNKLPNDIDRLMDEMERGLTLQGATANEDKLQPAVPETISLLSQAGMRVWMLTGDKQETAVNIGYATQLLDDGLETIMATAGSAGSAAAGAALVRQRAAELRDSGVLPPLPLAETQRRQRAAKRAALAARGVAVPISPALSQGTEGTGVAASDAAADAAVAEATGVELSALGDAPPGQLPTASSSALAPNPVATDGSNSHTGSVGGASDARSASAPRAVRSASMGTAGSVEGGGADSAGGVSPRRRRPRLDSRSVTFESDAQVIGQMSLQSLQQFGEHLGIQDTSTTGPQRRRRRRVGGKPLAIVIDDAVLDELLRPEHDSDGEGGGGGAAGGGTGGGFSSIPEGGQPSASLRSRASTVVRAFDEFLYSARAAVSEKLPDNLRPIEKAAPVTGSARDLLDLTTAAKAVVCCRCRPDQKAQMVKLVRDGVPRCRTLAIGDGANDVDMIRTAHVGVGIAGAEGMHAANASDYSFARFKFLQPLLLLHGRLNYLRISTLVNFMFYKNILLVLTQYWYSASTGFSGQKFYVELAAQSFNLLYTSLPVQFLGVFDRDADLDLMRRVPQLYRAGQGGQHLHKWVFLTWFSMAVAESLGIYYICEASARTLPDLTVFVFGSLCFTVVVLVVSVRISMEAYLHHWLFQLAVFLSVVMWIGAMFVFGTWRSDGVGIDGYERLFSTAVIYFDILLLVGIAVLPSLLWKSLGSFFSPTLRSIVMRASKAGGGAVAAVQSDLARGRLTADPLEAANAPMVHTQAGMVRRASQNKLPTSATRTIDAPSSTESAAAVAGGVGGGSRVVWTPNIPHPTSVFCRHWYRAAGGFIQLFTNWLCCMAGCYLFGHAPRCCKCAGQMRAAGPYKLPAGNAPPRASASPAAHSPEAGISGTGKDTAHDALAPATAPGDVAVAVGGGVPAHRTSRSSGDMPGGLTPADMVYMSDEDDSDADDAASTGGASTGGRSRPVRASNRRRLRNSLHGGGFTQDDAASEWLSTKFTASGLPNPVNAAQWLARERRLRGLGGSLKDLGGASAQPRGGSPEAGAEGDQQGAFEGDGQIRRSASLTALPVQGGLQVLWHGTNAAMPDVAGETHEDGASTDEGADSAAAEEK